MSPRAVPLLAALLMGALLSGCSDSPPSGDLAPAAHNVALGTPTGADVTIQARVDPINDAGGGGQVPPEASCAGNRLPPQLPADQFRCVDPKTTLNVTFTFPAGDDAGYNLFAVSSAGNAAKLGTLEPSADAPTEAGAPVTHTFDITYDEDLTTAYGTLEVRYGETNLTLASAPWGAGSQQFTANAELTTVTATGSYEGDELTVTVDGLPEGPWTGLLYRDDGTGVLTPVKSFNGIHNGENILLGDEDISSYQEFHIHLGATKVNVAKATIA